VSRFFRYRYRDRHQTARKLTLVRRCTSIAFRGATKLAVSGATCWASLSTVRLNRRRTGDKLAGGMPSFTLALLRSSIRRVQASPSTVYVYSREMVVGEVGIDGTSNSGHSSSCRAGSKRETVAVTTVESSAALGMKDKQKKGKHKQARLCMSRNCERQCYKNSPRAFSKPIQKWTTALTLQTLH
jgi:hypothetical protein